MSILDSLAYHQVFPFIDTLFYRLNDSSDMRKVIEIQYENKPLLEAGNGKLLSSPITPILIRSSEIEGSRTEASVWRQLLNFLLKTPPNSPQGKDAIGFIEKLIEP